MESPYHAGNETIEQDDVNQPVRLGTRFAVEVAATIILGARFSTRPWHSNNHSPVRDMMQACIMQLIQNRRKFCTPQFLTHLAPFAKQIERELYSKASSLEEYEDQSTLIPRLQKFTQEILIDANKLHREFGGTSNVDFRVAESDESKTIALAGPGKSSSQSSYDSRMVSAAKSSSSISSSSPAWGSKASHGSSVPVTSMGCSKTYIIHVLLKINNHVRTNDFLGRPFNFPSNIVYKWLEDSKEECKDEQCLQEELYYGGPRFDINDPGTYWTNSVQVYTWWKNNIQKGSKLINLVNDALYQGSDPHKASRSRWCDAVLVIAEDTLNRMGSQIGSDTSLTSKITTFRMMRTPTQLNAAVEKIKRLGYLRLTNPGGGFSSVDTRSEESKKIGEYNSEEEFAEDSDEYTEGDLMSGGGSGEASKSGRKKEGDGEDGQGAKSSEDTQGGNVTAGDSSGESNNQDANEENLDPDIDYLNQLLASDRKASSFPVFLHRMISEALPNEASWSQDGTCFILESGFEKGVMSKHPEFKTCNFDVFKRQLYRYGFRGRSVTQVNGTFHHPFFMRNEPQLAAFIKPSLDKMRDKRLKVSVSHATRRFLKASYHLRCKDYDLMPGGRMANELDYVYMDHVHDSQMWNSAAYLSNGVPAPPFPPSSSSSSSSSSSFPPYPTYPPTSSSSSMSSPIASTASQFPPFHSTGMPYSLPPNQMYYHQGAIPFNPQMHPSYHAAMSNHGFQHFPTGYAHMPANYETGQMTLTGSYAAPTGRKRSKQHARSIGINITADQVVLKTDEDMIDLTRPRKKRIFLDFTSPLLREQNVDEEASTDAGKNSSSSDGSSNGGNSGENGNTKSRKDSCIAIGPFHGTFHGEASASYQILNSGFRNSRLPPESLTDASNSYRNRRAQLGGSAVAAPVLVTHCSSVGEDYQAELPPLEPSPMLNNDKAEIARRNELKQDGLVWDAELGEKIDVDKYLHDIRCATEYDLPAVGCVLIATLPEKRSTTEEQSSTESTETTSQDTKRHRQALCCILQVLQPSDVQNAEQTQGGKLDIFKCPSNSTGRGRSSDTDEYPVFRVFDGEDEWYVNRSVFEAPRCGQIDTALNFLHQHNYKTKEALKPHNANVFAQIGSHFTDHFTSRNWTAEEVETLCDGVRRFGDNPRKIAAMIDSKTYADVHEFYHCMYPFAQSHGVRQFVYMYQRAERARWGNPDEEEPSEEESSDSSSFSEEEEEESEESESEEEGDGEDDAEEEGEGDVAEVSSKQHTRSSERGVGGGAGDEGNPKKRKASEAAGTSTSSSSSSSSSSGTATKPANKRSKASPPPPDERGYVATHGHFGRISQPRGTRGKRTVNYASLLYKGTERFMPALLADKLHKKPIAIPNPEHGPQSFVDPDAPLLCICRKPEDGEEYIRCNDGTVCSGWCHIKCVGLKKKSHNKIAKMTNFVCSECRAKSGEAE